MGLGRSLSVLVFEWVTGGGLAGSELPPSWAAEGRAMRSAIAADFASARSAGEPIRVLTTLDARLDEPSEPWEVVRIGPGAVERRLAQLAATVDCIVLIAPETNGVLADLTRGLETSPARLMGSTADAVEATADKARLAAILQAKGVTTPHTRIVDPRESLPPDATYPAVLKPIDGAGSLDTFLVRGPDDRPIIPAAISQAILQPRIAGQAMSASFLVDQSGRSSLIAMGRQRMAIVDGRFLYQGGELPTPLPEAKMLLIQALDAVRGLRGFVGVDFLWNQDREQATILEINPRPTTSYVGLARVLPPGYLAETWLEAMEESGDGSLKIDRFAGLIGDAPAIAFAADGSIREQRGWS